MGLLGGTYEIGPEQGDLIVETGREGAAARAGHDLTLLVTSWSATVTVDARSLERSSVRLTADPRSLVVHAARGGIAPLRDAQREEIVENIRRAVLHTDRHRTIRFRSTEVSGTLRTGVVSGELTIAGVTRPCRVEVVAAAGRASRVTATAEVAQTEFGITPYAALLGALRVRDEVRIALSVRMPSRP